MIDLHTHTTYSDGSFTPEEVLEEAEKKEVTILSITDHNTMDAYKELTNKKVRNKKAADNGKKPAQVDERYMKRAKELFYGEMAAALGINFKDVELYIKDSVESKGAATH